MPGWIELILMWPNRVGGIAALCGEAFRPYSAVLANLAGICYWWGWVPTCGLTVAAVCRRAARSGTCPGFPSPRSRSAILLLLHRLNLLRRPQGDTVAVVDRRRRRRRWPSCPWSIPVFAGTVDWHQATHYSLTSPFDGLFGSVTSAMAGLYLIGFAAPAFEAAACHVGETIDPNRNVPRAFLPAPRWPGLFFVAAAGRLARACSGRTALEGDLAPDPRTDLRAAVRRLRPGRRRLAHGAQHVPRHACSRWPARPARCRSCPRTGCCRACSRTRSIRDVPWVATSVTAAMSIVFLLLGDPVWMIAAANLTYLIGIALPSVAVWLLRRHSPELHRPYRALARDDRPGPVRRLRLGLSAVLGFQQFGLPTVIFGLVLAYSGAALYAVAHLAGPTARRGDGRRTRCT